MKKYVIALAGLAAAALVSCTREINPASPLDGTLRFTVSREIPGEGTRAALTGTDVVFEAGDAISVFDGNGNKKYVTEAGGAIATFTCASEADAAAAAEQYLVLSPYNAEAALQSPSVIRITIPEVQTAVPGGVDPKALVSAGIATGNTDVKLFNAVGLVKIEVPEGLEVKNIQVAGGFGQNIAICGQYDFNANEESLTLAPVAGKLSTVITLVPAEGESTIAPGTYYVAVRPKPDYDGGFTVAFVDGSNQLCKRATRTKADIYRSHILPLGALNTTDYVPVTGKATLRYADAAPQFTGLIKQLAGGAGGFTDKDTKIKKIIFKAHTLYSQEYKGGGNVISNGPNSTVQIHAYVKDDIAYVCTEAPIITLYSSSNNLFRDFDALEEVVFDDVNTMSGTTFEYMFRNCFNLKSVNFGNADFSLVTNYSNMFFNLTNLESVNFGRTAVNPDANTSLMMYNARNLKTLKLGPNFSLGKTATRMFDATAQQTSIDAAGDDAKKCQLYCSQAFYDSVAADHDDDTDAYVNSYFNKHRFTLNVVE